MERYCSNCKSIVEGHKYKTKTGQHKWACLQCNKRFFIDIGETQIHCRICGHCEYEIRKMYRKSIKLKKIIKCPICGQVKFYLMY